MAAATSAPEKPVAKSYVEPTFFAFKLLKQFKKEKDADSPFSLRTYLPRQDTILWAYIDDQPVSVNYQIKESDEVQFRPRQIRYVDGYKTFFVDEQETNGVAWPETDRRLTNENNYDKLVFFKGTLKVESFDATRKNFIQCLNVCENQHPNAGRFKSSEFLFKMLDFGFDDKKKVDLAQMRAKAFETANDAREKEMLPHAIYLGIATENPDGTKRSSDAIKADYIEYALKEPYKFRETFNDPKIANLEKIKQLIDKQQITLGGKVKGQAHWVNSGELIIELPTDAEPINFLAEYSLKKEGAKFAGLLQNIK